MLYYAKETWVVLMVYIIGIVSGLIIPRLGVKKKKHDTYSTKVVTGKRKPVTTFFDGKNPLDPYRQRNGLHTTFSARKNGGESD